MIHFKLASPTDKQEIQNLLIRNKLPVDDISIHLNNFILASDQSRIIGCIAAELYGEDGLLRSFAVDETYRSKGIGRQLYNHLLSIAIEHEVKNLHLLTTTAETYFRKLGFQSKNRELAPEQIKATEEFSVLCPSTSVYMVKQSIGASAVYFKSNLHHLKKEELTDSKYWVVKSKNLMFTWFEVSPGKAFPEHSHESEQMTYVLEGELFFQLDNEIFCLQKGDFISIPANKKHTVWTETNGAKAVDSWSPVNNMY